jgi:hypothetical protein
LLVPSRPRPCAHSAGCAHLAPASLQKERGGLYAYRLDLNGCPTPNNNVDYVRQHQEKRAAEAHRARNTVSKSWTHLFDEAGGEQVAHLVQLDHSLLSGSRFVRVDGANVDLASVTSDDGSVVRDSFRVGNHELCVVLEQTDRSPNAPSPARPRAESGDRGWAQKELFHYRLLVDGSVLPCQAMGYRQSAGSEMRGGSLHQDAAALAAEERRSLEKMVRLQDQIDARRQSAATAEAEVEAAKANGNGNADADAAETVGEEKRGEAGAANDGDGGGAQEPPERPPPPPPRKSIDELEAELVKEMVMLNRARMRRATQQSGTPGKGGAIESPRRRKSASSVARWLQSLGGGGSAGAGSPQVGSEAYPVFEEPPRLLRPPGFVYSVRFEDKCPLGINLVGESNILVRHDRVDVGVSVTVAVVVAALRQMLQAGNGSGNGSGNCSGMAETARWRAHEAYTHPFFTLLAALCRYSLPLLLFRFLPISSRACACSPSVSPSTLPPPPLYSSRSWTGSTTTDPPPRPAKRYAQKTFSSA